MGFATPMSPGKATAGIVQLKTDINVLLLAIPASFDIIGSSLMNVALTLIPASIY
jgi:drug/metabolite transporter (DMT)-like permease